MEPSNYIYTQRGAASILMAIVLLFAITIVSIFTARTTIMEQKISANEYRTKQTFEAAEAGMQYAIAYTQGGVDQDTAGTLDIFSQVTQSNGSKYTITLSGTFDPLVASTITVASVGLSDDGLATTTIRQDIIVAPPIGNPPSHPLITKSSTGITGNGDITNLESNATIWSGDTVTLSGSGNTYINDGSGSAELSSNSGTTGVDIIDQDSTLSGATDEEYFGNFFNGSKSFMEATADVNTTDPNTLDGITDSVIWVDGDVTLNSNTTIGSITEPVIMIINGNLQANGTANIYGLVYIIGDWDVQGTLNIVGAIIVEGAVSGSGTFNIVYNSNLSNGGLLDANIAVSPGTWRDFGS